MSVLTEVILTCSEPDYDDDPTRSDAPVNWVNSRLLDQEAGQQLVKIDTRVAGGNKVFCHDLWLACFNKLDRDWFLQTVRDAPWEEPEYVTVMWCRENPDDIGFVVAYQGERSSWP